MCQHDYLSAQIEACGLSLLQWSRDTPMGPVMSHVTTIKKFNKYTDPYLRKYNLHGIWSDYWSR